MRSVVDRNVVIGYIPRFSCAFVMFVASVILRKPL